LRVAVENATHHAWKSRFATIQVVNEANQLIPQLDSHALAVLRVVIGELVKQSKKAVQEW
jgi:hypothetical protein